MAQLSFGRTSGENLGCGLLGPEFNKEVPKIVLECCGSFHRSKLQVGKLGYVYALGVLMLCRRITVLARAVHEEDLCGLSHQPVSPGTSSAASALLLSQQIWHGGHLCMCDCGPMGLKSLGFNVKQDRKPTMGVCDVLSFHWCTVHVQMKGRMTSRGREQDGPVG